MRIRAQAQLLLSLIVSSCTLGNSTVHFDASTPRDGGAAQDGGACDEVVVCEGSTAVVRRCDVEVDRQTCDGACVPGLGCGCEPYASRCGDDGRRRVCAPDGAREEAFACEPGTLCEDGRCVDFCVREDVAPGSALGCDFAAISVLDTRIGLTASGRAAGPAAFRFGVLAMNPHDAPVTLRIDGLRGMDVVPSRTLPPRSTTALSLPWTELLAQPTPLGGPTPSPRSAFATHYDAGAYRLRSDRPIALIQLAPLEPHETRFPACTDATCLPATGDGSLLLPARAVGTQYTAIAWPTRAHWDACNERVVVEASGFVAIAGTSSLPTTVTVVPTVDVRDGATDVPPDYALEGARGGEPVTRTLTVGQVWQLVAAGPTTREECAPAPVAGCVRPCMATFDLTGTTVSASRPVHVISGHDCASIASDTRCGHLEEQVWPDALAGRVHVVPPSGEHDDATVVARIVALEDGTDVSIAPSGETFRLARGEALDVEAREGAVITSTEPVQVVRLLVSTNRASSMERVVPRERWSRSHRIGWARESGALEVRIVAPAGTTLELDGAPLTTRVSRLGEHEVHELSLEATQAPRLLEASAPVTVGATALGRASAASFPLPSP